MSGKFMRIRKIVIPTLTAFLIVSQLVGCAPASQSELLKMLQNGDQIEIEVAEPAFAIQEQGTEPTISWIQLAELTSNTNLRSSWDNQLGIIKTDIGKNGMLYVNQAGDNENNNMLAVAIHNREFQKWLESEDSLKLLSQAVVEQYADVEESPERADIRKQVYMGINGYFELLPDNISSYANGDSTITRAEAMAMVFRADTPVTELESDGILTNAVGANPLNLYAQGVVANSYLDINSKSLNNMTYTGTITRAEFIYMLISRYFSDELAIADITSQTFTDAKDGGNIASKQKFDTTLDYWKSYELTYALQNPDDGLPTELYKALVVAKQLSLISDETRWDEAITRVEAVELLCNALIKDDSIATYSFKQGTMTGYEAPTTPTTDSTESISQGNGTGEEVLAGGMTTMIDGKEVPCIIMDEDEDYIYAYVDPMYDPDGLGRTITIPKNSTTPTSPDEKAEATPEPTPTPTPEPTPEPKPEGNGNTGNSTPDIDWDAFANDLGLGNGDTSDMTEIPVDPNAPAYTGPRTPVY